MVLLTLVTTIHDTDDGRFFNEHKHANNKLLKHSLN
ncbi:hypothetical protein E3T09_04485 [Staphylococcus aureus]|nr:hypothetical protein [Staphylococcus aureus]QHK36858.1 hypothetical protein E3T09_04485 [Staphylococcus aureus]